MSKKITAVRFLYSGEVEIDLTEDDIKIIAEKYDGDYERYINNISVRKYDIDLDRDGEEYNSEAIKKALNLYLLNTPNLSDLINVSLSLDSMEISEERFNEYCKGKEVEIDKDMLKIVADVADFNNPKTELNYVYFAKNDIVATDTRRLIVFSNQTDLKNVLIHKAICLEYVNNEEAKLFVVDDYGIFLESEDKYYALPQIDPSRYPDYKRIIPKDIAVTISKDQYARDSAIQDYDGVEARALPILDGITLYIREEYMPKFEFETFSYNKYSLPVVFIGKDYTYVCMPLV